MEIFSHTQYLTDSTDGASDASGGAKPAPPLPQCSEILPAAGRAAGGSRCVILGEGFENGPGLSAQFGNSEPVKAQYHESGTILVTTPPRARGMVPVRIPPRSMRARCANRCGRWRGECARWCSSERRVRGRVGVALRSGEVGEI